jgi:hypothetical protein
MGKAVGPADSAAEHVARAAEKAGTVPAQLAAGLGAGLRCFKKDKEVRLVTGG